MMNNIRFYPDKYNIVIHTDIKDKKSLSYAYDGKTYVNYPIKVKETGLSLSGIEDNDGFLLVSKRNVRLTIKKLFKAKTKDLNEFIYNYVNEYIKNINAYNKEICLETELI